METTCAKCLDIRRNCKNKTTCKKCKDAAKASRERDAVQAAQNELKELVKTNPRALLSSWSWSKDAILTALAGDAYVAEEVLRKYSEKDCYHAHSPEVRSLIRETALKAYKKSPQYEAYIQGLVDNAAYMACQEYDEKSAYRKERYFYLKTRYEECTFIRNNPWMELDDWMKAVQRHPGILQVVPVEHRTYELCLTAVTTQLNSFKDRFDNFPLQFVPEEHLSEELCLAAAWCKNALYFFPKKYHTKEMMLRAARVNPKSIEASMPHPFPQDPDIRKVAAEHAALKLLCEYTLAEADVTASMDCALCLADFEVGEPDVVKMTDCTHIYHKPCILAWLAVRDSCPKCNKRTGGLDDSDSDLDDF